MASRAMSREQIETLLSEILTPVEPSTQFVRSLKARLVTYQGSGALSPWMVMAIIGTALALAITSIGVLLRMIVGLISLFGLLSNRRQAKSGTSAPA
jgi:tetrahydromethanopterin S-methyltransferase subunit B